MRWPVIPLSPAHRANNVPSARAAVSALRAPAVAAAWVAGPKRAFQREIRPGVLWRSANVRWAGMTVPPPPLYGGVRKLCIGNRLHELEAGGIESPIPPTKNRRF